MATGNGGTNGAPTQPQGAAPGQEKPPQLNVLAQYIKDFSFENPNAPKALKPGQQPQINIQVTVNAAPVEGADLEVVLKIEGKAESEGLVLFGFELAYCGVFRVQNVPQESMHPVVMIECPRLLFPFAREIIATTVSNGGFPPLMLDPVDFVALYRQNLAKMQPPAPAQA